MFTITDIENNKNIKRKTFIYQDYKISYYTDGKTIAITNNGINNIENGLIYFNTIEELKRFVDGFNSRKYFFEDIEYLHKDILLDYTNDIGYHFSNKDNRESILKLGLLSGKNGTPELLQTSLLMDLYKPKKFPKNFYKTTSVYLYPKFDQWINETESDVYAVDISNIDYYVGSFFLSGMALNNVISIDWNREDLCENEYSTYMKLYWNNCYSKKEFLKNSKKVQTSKKTFGLLEILIPIKIKPERITHIGTFSLGRFLPTKDFSKFVKPEYKDSYRKILIEHLTR